MLISELAHRTGLTIDTIRFYEKQGLLLNELHYERSANGYRHYSEAAYQRLVLIRLGQAAGFTLNQMAQSIQAWESDELSRAEKVAYLCQKLEEIGQKVQALNDMRAYLGSKIEAMRQEDEVAHESEAQSVSSEG